MMLAALRPDDWNLPLLVHVTGAMLLVGFLVAAAAGFARAAGGGEPGEATVLTRFGFRALLLGALPAWVVMRGGGEWLASTEDLAEPTWLSIGYVVSEPGLLVLVAAAVVARRAARRTEAGGAPSRAALALTMLLIVAFAVAVWAMTAKPG